MRYPAFLLALAASSGCADTVEPTPPSFIGRIVFSSHRTGGWRLYSMLPDGSDLTQVPIAPLGNLHNPSVSPDGQRVAFQVGNDIYTAKADGTDLVHVVAGPASNGRPRWSPDGLEIAFHSIRTGAHDLYAIRPDGTGLRQITSSPEPDFLGDWSPSGSSLAFSRQFESGPELAVVNADGSGYTQVPTLAGGGSASWSPDGGSLVYVSGADGGIHIIEVSGANDRLVVPSGQTPSNPAWSPDGELIAFSQLFDGNPEIVIVRSDGGDSVRLTQEPAPDISPAWGPIE